MAIKIKRRGPSNNDPLSVTHPDLSAQWDEVKNWTEHRQDPSWPDFPWNVKAGCGRKVWWICAQGHRYLCTPSHRAGGIGCSICAIIKGNALSDIKPEVAEEWAADLNYDEHQNDPKWPVSSRLVSIYSAKKAWWRCRECSHEWIYRIDRKDSKAGECPECHPKRIGRNHKTPGRSKLQPGVNDLGTIYPDLARIWDDERNQQTHNSNPHHPTTIHDILPSSTIAEPYWKCDDCEAHWQSTLPSILRTYSKGSKPCPKCRKRDQYKNGVVSDYPHGMTLWDFKKNLEEFGTTKDQFLINADPRFTPASGATKVWWRCPNCDRSWKTSASKICLTEYGCLNCQKLQNGVIADYDLLMQEWDYEKNGELDPNRISRGNASIPIWWKCSKCNYSYKTVANTRTNASRAKGCPKCASFTRGAGVSELEKEIYNFVKDRYPQFDVVWHDIDILPDHKDLDIYFPEIRKAIEVNGDYWHNNLINPQAVEKNQAKMRICKSESIVLVNVWESDWWLHKKEIIKALDDFILNDAEPDPILLKDHTIETIQEKRELDKQIKRLRKEQEK